MQSASYFAQIVHSVDGCPGPSPSSAFTQILTGIGKKEVKVIGAFLVIF